MSTSGNDVDRAELLVGLSAIDEFAKVKTDATKGLGQPNLEQMGSLEDRRVTAGRLTGMPDSVSACAHLATQAQRNHGRAKTHKKQHRVAPADNERRRRPATSAETGRMGTAEEK